MRKAHSAAAGAGGAGEKLRAGRISSDIGGHSSGPCTG